MTDAERTRDDAAERAREYYRALDDHDYDALTSLLSPAFVQERPDLTLRGRDRFVRFMREERPQTDTTHVVEGVFEPTGEGGGAPAESGIPAAGDAQRDGDARHGGDVAVRGRLLGSDGDLLTRYVDVFGDGADGFERLDTYTR